MDPNVRGKIIGLHPVKSHALNAILSPTDLCFGETGNEGEEDISCSLNAEQDDFGSGRFDSIKVADAESAAWAYAFSGETVSTEPFKAQPLIAANFHQFETDVSVDKPLWTIELRGETGVVLEITLAAGVTELVQGTYSSEDSDDGIQAHYITHPAGPRNASPASWGRRASLSVLRSSNEVVCGRFEAVIDEGAEWDIEISGEFRAVLKTSG